MRFERVSDKDLSVKMFVDGKLIGIFPTEKRGRLFYEGSRDINGKRISVKDTTVKQIIEEKAIPTSGTASQKNDEPQIKRRGRKRLAKDDRS